MLRQSFATAFAAALVFSACSGGDGGTTTTEWAGTVTDSAGIQLVQNPLTPIWGADDAWTLEETLLIGTPEGDAAYQFGQITGIGFTSDGRVIVSYSWMEEGPLRLVDLETGGVEDLPGTVGLAGVASSPDGRSVAAHDFGRRAERGGGQQIRLLDWETGSWTAVEGAVGGVLQWSSDGRDLYFSPDHRSVCRVRPEGGEIETVATFGRLRPEGVWWSVDPEGRLVRLRSLHTSDIFTWDLKIP